MALDARGSGVLLPGSVESLELRWREYILTIHAIKRRQVDRAVDDILREVAGSAAALFVKANGIGWYHIPHVQQSGKQCV